VHDVVKLDLLLVLMADHDLAMAQRLHGLNSSSPPGTLLKSILAETTYAEAPDRLLVGPATNCSEVPEFARARRLPDTDPKGVSDRLPVGPVSNCSAIRDYGRRLPDTDPKDVSDWARWTQLIQMYAESLDRSEERLANHGNTRSGIDTEGLGSQLRAHASGTAPHAGSLGATNRGATIHQAQARPGFASAATTPATMVAPPAAVKERLKQCGLDPWIADAVVSRGSLASDVKGDKGLSMVAAQAAAQAAQSMWIEQCRIAAAFASSRGGAVASDSSKGQKGHSAKSSPPQMGKSSHPHAFVGSCKGDMPQAPPGTWSTQHSPSKKHATQEQARAPESAARQYKNGASAKGLLTNGPRRDAELGGLGHAGSRAVGLLPKTVPASNIAANVALDRRADWSEAARCQREQAHSKGLAAAQSTAAGLKHQKGKKREKQPYPVAITDEVSISLRRCKFARIEEDTLRFELSAEELQDTLQPEAPEGVTLLVEDELLASRSPWDYGYYDRSQMINVGKSHI